MEPARETLSTGMGSRRPSPPGRADTFSAIVRAYTRLVRLAAWQAGAPEADLADVVQETFLRLAKAMGDAKVDASAPLDGWLRRTTYRLARDRRDLARNARENVTATGEMEMEDTAPGAEEQMATIDVHRMVNAILDELPRVQRDVLVMHDMGELPMSQIAEDLGIPLGTGYTRLRAARHAFKDKLAAKLASGNKAFLPFVLWDMGDLVAAARVPPPAPAGFEDEVATRAAAAVAAQALAAGGAAAAKAGVVLTGAQIAAGIVVAMIAGAVLHALFVVRSEPVMGPPPASSAVARREVHETAEPAGSAAASAEGAATVVVVTPAASAGDTRRAAGATAAPVVPPTADVSERTLLTNARNAIDRGEPEVALALLARVKNPRYATLREDLRRLALAAQDGGR